MFQKLIAALAMAVLATAARAGVAELKPTEGVPTEAPGARVDETPRLWFVELAGTPTSEGGDDGALQSEHQRFRDEAVRSGITYGERRAFRSLFNGFSVAVKPSELGKLRRMAGV
jgi:minor extracellular serine protease Vpr